MRRDAEKFRRLLSDWVGVEGEIGTQIFRLCQSALSTSSSFHFPIRQHDGLTPITTKIRTQITQRPQISQIESVRICSFCVNPCPYFQNRPHDQLTPVTTKIGAQIAQIFISVNPPFPRHPRSIFRTETCSIHYPWQGNLPYKNPLLPSKFARKSTRAIHRTAR